MFTIRSSAFADQQSIPKKYSLTGGNVSPPLEWSGAPEGARSFALIVEDPDAPDPRAPSITWVHWVVYDIPAATHALHEASSGGELPDGARQGLNDWYRVGYGGPSPPIGRHRYFHRLFALDTVLGIEGHPDKAALLDAMRGHVLAETELVGTCEAPRRN